MIYIGFGSNIGERFKNILFAMRLMERFKIHVLRTSSIYKTESVGVKQQYFFNAVAEVNTLLPPESLLFILKWIERRIGRNKKKWAPRKIDLDILFYKDIALMNKRLCIPHKRVHERAFMLLPLSELSPSFIHPLLKKSISELLNEVGTSGVTLWRKEWRK